MSFDFLEALSLGFGHIFIEENGRYQAHECKGEKAGTDTDLVNVPGKEEGRQEVDAPVGESGYRHGTSPDTGRKNLPDQHPNYRVDGEGQSSHVHAQHDHDPNA